jgi:hypothetical protein
MNLAESASGRTSDLLSLAFCACFMTLTHVMRAQERPGDLWQVVAGTALQYNFGPQQNQAEITGGPDSLFFGNIKTYGIGFKPYVPIGLTAGRMFGENFQMEVTVGYYSLDMAWQYKLDGEVQKEYTSDVMHIGVSGCLVIPGNSAASRTKWLSGFSAGVARPLEIREKSISNPDFAPVSLKPATLFNFSLLSYFDIRLFRGGWFARAGVFFDFPGVLAGSIAKVAPYESPVLTTLDDEVKMYTLRAMAGLGYRFGARGKQE